MGPLSGVVASLLQELEGGIKKNRADLTTLWPQIAGPAISAHTQPSLTKTGTLCVKVDRSVLASELSQRYQGSLLKRTEEALGEGTVKKIVFHVGQIR